MQAGSHSHILVKFQQAHQAKVCYASGKNLNLWTSQSYSWGSGERNFVILRACMKTNTCKSSQATVQADW